VTRLPIISRTWNALLYRVLVPRDPRMAVLIDTDGISPADASLVLDHVAALGRVCILRTYGNFTGKSAQAWTRVVRRYGAVARHMPSVAPGKNASDIALSIDAVELLLTRQIETFVLIASDSDFAPLAQRIREQGKDALGFGTPHTPDSFRRACSAFSEFGDLIPPDKHTVTPEGLWSHPPGDAEGIILNALMELGGGHDPVPLQTLGEHLVRHHPEFDSRIYRRRNLSSLLRDLPSVEVTERDGQRYARPVKSAG
jgi:hypothetical protein